MMKPSNRQDKALKKGFASSHVSKPKEEADTDAHGFLLPMQGFISAFYFDLK